MQLHVVPQVGDYIAFMQNGAELCPIGTVGNFRLTSNVRLSASFATVILASSPSPNSLETASSTGPRMKHFPDDGRKVIGSSRRQAVSK